jgi:hypothetical protein
VLAGSRERFHVVLEYGLERLPVGPLGMLGSERPDAVDGKEELEVERLLGPQGAVVVEGGDALGLRHEVGAGRIGDSTDKIEDRRFGIPVIPGRQRIGRSGGLVSHSRRAARQEGNR